MTRHERIEVINQHLVELDDERLEGLIKLLSKVQTDSQIMDEETEAWHNADLSRLDDFEPYDWREIDPLTYGEPLRIVR